MVEGGSYGMREDSYIEVFRERARPKNDTQREESAREIVYHQEYSLVYKEYAITVKEI